MYFPSLRCTAATTRVHRSEVALNSKCWEKGGRPLLDHALRLEDFMRRHGCPLVDLNMVNILLDSGADPNQTWSRYHLPVGRSEGDKVLVTVGASHRRKQWEPSSGVSDPWYPVHLATIRAGARWDCVEVPVVLEGEPVRDVSKVCQYMFEPQRAALLDAETQIPVERSLGMNIPSSSRNIALSRIIQAYRKWFTSHLVPQNIPISNLRLTLRSTSRPHTMYGDRHT
jgi:hypothetical protein